MIPAHPHSLRAIAPYASLAAALFCDRLMTLEPALRRSGGEAITGLAERFLISLSGAGPGLDRTGAEAAFLAYLGEAGASGTSQVEEALAWTLERAIG